MDKTSLVEQNLKDGRELLDLLDKERFPVDAALWLYMSESGDWRLMIASSIYDKKGPRKAYTLVQALLAKLPRTVGISLHDITVVGLQHDLILRLRKAFSTGSGSDPSGLRLTRSAIGGMFIEDAYVYRSR